MLINDPLCNVFAPSNLKCIAELPPNTPILIYRAMNLSFTVRELNLQIPVVDHYSYDLCGKTLFFTKISKQQLRRFIQNLLQEN